MKKYLSAFVVLIAAVVILAYTYGTTRNESLALTYVERGNEYFGSGPTYDLRKAERLYERALKADPLVPDAWHQLARIEFLRGNFDTALRKINIQLEVHGDELMASYYIRGLIYGYKNDFANAEQDFKAFLEWDPENWAALNDLAWIYFSQGKFEDSLQAAERGLAVSPSSPWLLTMRGMSKFNLHNSQGALDDLMEAQRVAETLSDSDWVRAYPGNDPKIAQMGLASMRAVIANNIELVHRSLAAMQQ